MSKHQEAKKIQQRSEVSTKEIQEHLHENSAEVNDLINSPDFKEFVQTISTTIDDDTTFNEMFSSRIILQKALAILKKLENESKQK
ncbi:MAG: hypothetical protein KAS22_05685 [Candidatus Heimdallarchaeota archaeon]|nr:hypothetical protein [Candidatus Heimdallarchaeota archaeon]